MQPGSTGPVQPTPGNSLSKRLKSNHKTGDHGPVDLFKTADKPKPQEIQVSYLPQDPGILPPATVTVPAAEVQAGPSNGRLRVSESPEFPPARPDADGNLVFEPEDPRFDSTQTFVIADRSLRMAQRYLGRELPWGFAQDLGRDQLIIHPHVGANVPNAFYSSQSGSVNFFHFIDPVTKEVVRTGQSADVVAHEVGHALLDALRHEYIGSLSIHGGGFHESFGDMTAMLTALQDDQVLELLYAETSGDLSKPNVISRAAEQLGETIGHLMGKPREHLRSAINDHKYLDQHFLPYVDKEHEDGLGQESHAYSNLFTGAFYELFATTQKITAGMNPNMTFAESVKHARDLVGGLLFRAVELGPVGDPSFREMAQSFLRADIVDNGGENLDVLAAVFSGRGLLREADLEEIEKSMSAVPDVKLPEGGVEGKEAAEKFFASHREALGLPERPLEFLDKRVNEDGETILLYKFSRHFPIEGPEFGVLEGSKAEATGGLTLAFDKEGKLECLCLDDVTDREIEDIRFHLRKAVSEGMLVAQGLGPDAGTTDADRLLKSLRLSRTGTPSGYVLRRSPEIWG